MAIAEMRKLNLAAMSYDRDAVLDALQRTGAAEIKESSLQGEERLCVNRDDIKARLTAAESALEILSAEITLREEPKDGKRLLKNGFDVSYTDFISCGKESAKFDSLARDVKSLADERTYLKGELARCSREAASAQIYSCINQPMDDFTDSARVCVRLGTAERSGLSKLQSAAENTPLFAYEVLARSDSGALICVAFHSGIKSEGEGILAEAGFTACPVRNGQSGAEYYAGLLAEGEEIFHKIIAASNGVYALKDELRPLKVYCDYLGYLLEKAEATDKMVGTERTFLLEAYVPKDCEESVKTALSVVAGTVYYEFSDPAEDETPPTLMKNNSIVRNFEAVTNMYSPPSPKEFDPNAIMAVFYSIFLGFIMADVGYGLMMLLGGGAIWYATKRDTGMKRVAGVFAVGGIFAIIWGVLFNSFFGLELPFAAVLPNAQRDMWTLVGIRVPAVLVISLLLGCAQLCAGYFCKLVQCWRRGQFFDGLCDGLTWSVFTVGATLAIVGFIEEADLPILVTVGGITAAAGLVAAMLTAGRKEKFFGKFTKGFGAAYGIINFVSDILSYARLYGLMLSGAVIAQVVSGYAVQFFAGGGAGIVLGIIILPVGHIFNLAMSLLGAYIHDARLQYVEFYGRFFEGEGELFRPLGSAQKYVYLLR